MTMIKAHVSIAKLEARYKTAVDPIGKSHFHVQWLLSCGYEVAELLAFSSRWVRALVKRYNEAVQRRLVISETATEQSRRSSPPMLAALKERIKTPPDDGGLWTGPKIAR